MTTIWITEKPSRAHFPRLEFKCDCGWKDRCYDERKILVYGVIHLSQKHEGNGTISFKGELQSVSHGRLLPSTKTEQMYLSLE